MVLLCLQLLLWITYERLSCDGFRSHPVKEIHTNVLDHRNSQSVQSLQHRLHTSYGPYVIQSEGGVLVGLNVLNEACVLIEMYKMVDGISLRL